MVLHMHLLYMINNNYSNKINVSHIFLSREPSHRNNGHIECVTSILSQQKFSLHKMVDLEGHAWEKVEA